MVVMIYTSYIVARLGKTCPVIQNTLNTHQTLPIVRVKHYSGSVYELEVKSIPNSIIKHFSLTLTKTQYVPCTILSIMVLYMLH